ncbi:MAG: diguanylate cyclase [Desulfobulbaceae bacterium]|jgi:diguanylate cyclase (GGDEF)-like protein|nr:diguanylate cyclase [Desulfobulbaceae bacterium]
MSASNVTSNREIFSRMNLTEKLPSPPRMAMELVRLCHTESASLDDLVKLIEADPALSVALLRAANRETAPMVANTSQIISIPEAALGIGKHGVIGLALGFSLSAKIPGGPCQSFHYERFWSQSLARAIAAAAIAEKSGVAKAGDMYACGLLAAIGELVLATSFPGEYDAILAHKPAPDRLLSEEKSAFGLNQHELTVELFHEWGLPRLFGQVAALHTFSPDIETSAETPARLIELLYMAHKISEICLADPLNQRDFALVEQMAARFGLGDEEFPNFFDDIATLFDERGELLRIRSQKSPSYREIKVMDVPRGEYGGYQPTGRLSILAVDDDPISLQTLTQYLRGKNRRVLTARSGEQALNLALEEKPDMVITDWRMPDLDGIGLCKILRRTSLTEHMYIIVLSGCESDDELVQAFNAGADDYVVKPFSPKVLEARIRSGERLLRYHQTIVRDREIIQQYASQLSIANSQHQVMAMTDQLTGLSNRRNAMLRMKDAVAQATRFQDALSCIMLDIDHFKRINDTYGHDIGDLVLRDVAKIFTGNVRGYDMVSRIGGEEFLVICGRSGLDETRQLAERLCQAVARHETRSPTGQIVRCTVSCGVATWHQHYLNGSEFLKNADIALYKAKNAGRNRVEVAD